MFHPKKHARFIVLLAGLLALSLIIVVPPVVAQDVLTPYEATHSGQTNLSAGFLPDPFTASLISGGPVNAYTALPGLGCYGYVISNPDYRVNWSGMTNMVRFFIESEADTTILVRSPTGQWFCNDDSYGTLHPSVDVPNPVAGDYNIWVGSFVADVYEPATLYVTEIGSYHPNNTASPPAAGLDFAAATHSGENWLSAGFLNDPFTTPVISSGPVRVSDALAGLSQNGYCNGYVISNPDYRLHWDGNSGMVRFYVIGDVDTTLVVRTPGGQYFCNDDSYGSLNPTVDIHSPSAGDYNIWIGSFSPDDYRNATLYITEMSGFHP